MQPISRVLVAHVTNLTPPGSESGKPYCAVDNFLPLHKATLQHAASAAAIEAGKAVTVLTYLHGTKESEDAIVELMVGGACTS